MRRVKSAAFTTPHSCRQPYTIWEPSSESIRGTRIAAFAAEVASVSATSGGATMPVTSG